MTLNNLLTFTDAMMTSGHQNASLLDAKHSPMTTAALALQMSQSSLGPSSQGGQNVSAAHHQGGLHHPGHHYGVIGLGGLQAAAAASAANVAAAAAAAATAQANSASGQNGGMTVLAYH